MTDVLIELFLGAAIFYFIVFVVPWIVAASIFGIKGWKKIDKNSLFTKILLSRKSECVDALFLPTPNHYIAPVMILKNRYYLYYGGKTILIPKREKELNNVIFDRLYNNNK